MSKVYRNTAEVVCALKPSKSIYCFAPNYIKKQVELFKNNFPGTVSWAVKSNPQPVVIKTMNIAGVHNFDVASIKEIDLIYHLCPGARLHFNHPVKAPEAIKLAYEKYGIRIFVVDHVDEMQKIASAFQARDIIVVVRFFDPTVVPASHVNFGKKFGASPQEAIEIMTHAQKLGFKEFGLAFHPSTQYPDPTIYAHLLNVGIKIMQSCGHIEFKLVNVGGGFPTSYPSEKLPDEKEYLQIVAHAVKNAKKKFGDACEFICEPGRALVANCASLLTRVELNRHDGRLYLNDGFYGALMEQHFVDFALPIRVHSHNQRILSQNYEDCILFGPTCDSIDVLRKNYRLPKDIDIGDYIEFGLMGAYTNACSTHFNGFEPADMIYVEELHIL